MADEHVPHSTELPAANPDCTHVWDQDPQRMVWVCRDCGYEVTELERQRQHEGETDTGRRRRFRAR